MYESLTNYYIYQGSAYCRDAMNTLLVTSILVILLLAAAMLSLPYSGFSPISSSASTNNDNNEDFEDQNSIQICCAWGEECEMGF